MKRGLVFFWTVFSIIAISITTGAQVDKAISFEDFKWLAGRWIGEGFGGICEEAWNPELGGSMAGSFKLVVDDKPNFYELMVISMREGEPVLQIKHFDPELKGWEEKDESVEFAFKSLSEHRLEFDGIVYELIAANRINITVTSRNPEGGIETTLIECTRQ